MQNLLTSFAARILGAWIAALASWLLVKYGVTVDVEAQQQLTEHLVGVVIPTFLTLYAVAHRLVSKKTNPGDAASTHLAAKESDEAANLKR